MEQSYEVPLSEYWRIIRKRKLTIAFVFIAVVLSTLVFTSLQTPVYDASVELKIEKTVPLGADLKAVNEAASRVEDLGTELRIFKSLGVLTKVVEKVDVLPVEPQAREQVLHAKAVEYQNRIRVEQVPDTTLITIHATANNPESAQLLASAVADVYMSENTHGRKKQLESVLKYIDGQLTDDKKQLEDVESKLLKFKQDEKVFEVTPQIKANLDRMTVDRTFEFESEMLKLDEELKGLQAAIDEKKAQGTLRAPTPEQVSDNYIFTGLKRRLLGLEFERFLLLVDYTENHPLVMEKDKVISDVKARMVEMIRAHSDKPMDADAEADLALVLKKLFLESRREVLYRTINKYYSDQGSLSSNQRDYVNLTRDQERIMTAYNTLLNNREEAKLSLASTDDQSVSIISPASARRDPVSPNGRLNLLVSILAGMVLGMLACFLQESMDTTISTLSDVEHKINLSVLGIIPIIKTEDTEGTDSEDPGKIVPKIDTLVTLYDPRSWLAQSFKILRTNILQIMKQGDKKVLLFTSSEQEEGKSTVIANVAISLAQLGKKTLLVGLNLRRPSLYKRFGIPRSPGMTDVLIGKLSWQEAMSTSTDILVGGLDVDKLLKMPGLDNLKIIDAGHALDNISEVLISRKLDDFLTDVRQHFDVVLVDCPPVLPVPDAMTLGSRVDGVILVYKVGKTSRDVLQMAKSRLEHANARVLGIVLNQIKAEEQVGASAYHFREYVEATNKPLFSPADWFSKG